jgi:hypothetical protein
MISQWLAYGDNQNVAWAQIKQFVKTGVNPLGRPASRMTRKLWLLDRKVITTKHIISNLLAYLFLYINKVTKSLFSHLNPLSNFRKWNKKCQPLQMEVNCSDLNIETNKYKRQNKWIWCKSTWICPVKTHSHNVLKMSNGIGQTTNSY